MKSKFDTQDVVKVREVKIPQITLSKLDTWFYTSKESRLDDEIYEMQIE